MLCYAEFDSTFGPVAKFTFLATCCEFDLRTEKYMFGLQLVAPSLWMSLQDFCLEKHLEYRRNITCGE